jgi:hypothetical protein
MHPVWAVWAGPRRFAALGPIAQTGRLHVREECSAPVRAAFVNESSLETGNSDESGAPVALHPQRPGPIFQGGDPQVGKPLVTVIIIFFNAERFIEEAIESVFAQTYDAWELVTGGLDLLYSRAAWCRR